MSETAAYTPILRFIDQSESFVLGYELGSFVEKFLAGEQMEDVLIHRKNQEQIKLFFESDMVEGEYSLAWSDCNEDFLTLTVKPFELRVLG